MIPVHQLVAWSGYPNPRRSVAAHAQIKSALLGVQWFHGQTVEVYIQGSYRNHVNTRENSDVDVVAELTSVCEHDVRRMAPWDQSRFWDWIPRSEYGYQEFRDEVHSALAARFGQAVDLHSKAIEVKGTFWRLKVDVLPVLRYKQVYAFDGANVCSDDGIAFWTPDRRRVVNWPHHHFNNGVSKNQRTGEHFKPAVRMLKNARAVAMECGIIAEASAPSYFVQGMLWNVPDELYTSDLSSTYQSVVGWLSQNPFVFQQFRCQNGIDPLFGASPEQWDLNEAFAVVNSLVRLWNEWA